MASSPEHRPTSSSTASSAPESASYAFLNHSSYTVPNNLPPNVDNKPLARQRRRRTSPEDQLILETAYSRDTKPDKAARLKLVKQVALGEKEVQIWFQNRRQTSRRKCRPLLPHEIASYSSSWAGPFPASDSSKQVRPEGMNDAPALSLTKNHNATTHPDHAVRRDLPSDLKQIPSFELTNGHHDSSPISDSFRPMGYLANRRSATFLRSNDESSGDVVDTDPGPKVGVISKVKRSSSFVRLAMTSDGKASVTTKDISSPSPPRPSESANPQSSGAKYFASSSSPSLANRPVGDTRVLTKPSIGRARDSRTWEFWCDKQARFDLQEKAEKDASGSAADAIGLLRSTSGRAILGTASWRKNLLNPKHNSAAKRTKFHPYGVLQRSSTAVERSVDTESWEIAKEKRPMPARTRDSDSDKENQSPREDFVSSEETGSQDNHNQRSHMSIQRSHTFHGYDLDGVRKSRARPVTNVADGNTENESSDPEVDPEIASFMRGGIATAASSQEEDLDCVQGLLRLSQGNWR